MIPLPFDLAPCVLDGITVLEIGPDHTVRIEPGDPAVPFGGLDHLLHNVGQIALAVDAVDINLAAAHIRHNRVGRKSSAVEIGAVHLFGIGHGNGKVIFGIEPGILTPVVADDNIIGLQLVKHDLGVRALIAVVAGDDNIHRAEVLADGLGGAVNGPVVDVNIRKVDHGIIAVGHDGHDGVDIFAAGVGLFVEVIQAEGHVAHGEGNIVAVGVARVTLNDLLAGDFNHVGAHVLHGFGRLIIKSLVVPGEVGILDKVVFDIGDMLILLIEIGGIVVDKVTVIAAGIVKTRGSNFRDAADMIHVGMGANDEVQMPHAQDIHHILGDIAAVAHGDLTGILIRRREGNDPAVGVLYGIGIAVAAVHQTPLAVGFDQDQASLHTVKAHIEGIHPVRRIGDRILTPKGKNSRQDDQEGKHMQKGSKRSAHHRHLKLKLKVES